MLLEASGVVQDYFGSLWRLYDKQADLLRAMVILYDDTMNTFERNLHELEKTNDSKYEVTNETIIQLCTGRVKDLKGRLEALVPVMDGIHSTITRYIPTTPATITLAPPEQLVPAKTEQNVNISLKRRADSLHERTGSTLVERNAKVLSKRSMSAPPERRTNALDEQSASGPSEHQLHRGTPMCT
ncbi:unnamed protein product [Alternaria burnsii]|nr:unnamed protein product [Alternaria burnsii]